MAEKFKPSPDLYKQVVGTLADFSSESTIAVAQQIKDITKGCFITDDEWTQDFQKKWGEELYSLTTRFVELDPDKLATFTDEERKKNYNSLLNIIQSFVVDIYDFNFNVNTKNYSDPLIKYGTHIPTIDSFKDMLKNAQYMVYDKSETSCKIKITIVNGETTEETEFVAKHTDNSALHKGDTYDAYFWTGNMCLPDNSSQEYWFNSMFACHFSCAFSDENEDVTVTFDPYSRENKLPYMGENYRVIAEDFFCGVNYTEIKEKVRPELLSTSDLLDVDVMLNRECITFKRHPNNTEKHLTKNEREKLKPLFDSEEEIKFLTEKEYNNIGSKYLEGYGINIDDENRISAEVEYQDTCDDAARAILGGGWRIPTKAEWQELIDNCIWQHVSDGNYYAIFNKNIDHEFDPYNYNYKKYLFLYEGGYYDNDMNLDNNNFYFLTSDIYKPTTEIDDFKITILYADGENNIEFKNFHRYYGCQVMAINTTNDIGNVEPELVVDLDLPSKAKWYNYPLFSDYGTFFAWGETNGKEKYTPMNYKYLSSDLRKMLKYNYEDNKKTLDLGGYVTRQKDNLLLYDNYFNNFVSFKFTDSCIYYETNDSSHSGYSGEIIENIFDIPYTKGEEFDLDRLLNFKIPKEEIIKIFKSEKNCKVFIMNNIISNLIDSKDYGYKSRGSYFKPKSVMILSDLSDYISRYFSKDYKFFNIEFNELDERVCYFYDNRLGFICTDKVKLTDLLGNNDTYVDLGLSVKWCKESYDEVCSWGEIETKDYFIKENYDYNKIDDYIKENDLINKLPTELEFRELCDNCDFFSLGHSGVVAVSRINGKAIRLTGKEDLKIYNNRYDLYADNREIVYWTMSLFDKNNCNAFNIYNFHKVPMSPSDFKSLKGEVRRNRYKGCNYHFVKRDSGKEINYIDGHEYVDLGLPSGLKWATMNVGASKNNDYGTYYAWGEIAPASGNNYSEANCKAYDKSSSSLKESGVLDANGNLTADYDAAIQNWGGKWRMPTHAEFDELFENCTWTWTSLGGVNGYKVESKVNDNYIFLPATGYRNGTSSSKVGSYGDYWSSTVNEYNSNFSYYLYFDFDSSINSPNTVGHRYYGYTVRPVSE